MKHSIEPENFGLAAQCSNEMRNHVLTWQYTHEALSLVAATAVYTLHNTQVRSVG